MSEAEKLARRMADAVHPHAHPDWVRQTIPRLLPYAEVLVRMGEALKGYRQWMGGEMGCDVSHLTNVDWRTARSSADAEVCRSCGEGSASDVG